MSKTALVALLGAVALGAGVASAAERAAVEPSAPSFVRELGAARTATVGGTVVEVRGRRFVLADAENGRIRVEAAHAIREDGSVAPSGEKLAGD